MKQKYLFGWILWLAFANAHSAEYKYVNYSVPDDFENGRSEFVLNSSSKEILTTDVVSDIFVCEQGKEFYCFSCAWISFYVPTAGLDIGKNWKFDQIAFRVLRKDSIEIFGTSNVIWIIEANRSGRAGGEQIFYYSEENGLLGIKSITGKDRRIDFFVIAGKKGFPR